jgi:hypothetical protein
MKILFEPRDLWVGLYIGPRTQSGLGLSEWRDFYLILIPTIVLKIRWWYRKKSSQVGKESKWKPE